MCRRAVRLWHLKPIFLEKVDVVVYNYGRYGSKNRST